MCVYIQQRLNRAVRGLITKQKPALAKRLILLTPARKLGEITHTSVAFFYLSIKERENRV